MTVAERMVKDGWRRLFDCHREMTMQVAGWSIDVSPIGACLVDEAVAFLWNESQGRSHLIQGRYGLRDLAQRAKAAARRLARKGKR